eukprot:m.94876 g.94876  ORF g.94876 m.94876 type:complete len:262 (-) comp26762_c5_seq1:91-876(-)
MNETTNQSTWDYPGSKAAVIVDVVDEDIDGVEIDYDGNVVGAFTNPPLVDYDANVAGAFANPPLPIGAPPPLPPELPPDLPPLPSAIPSEVNTLPSDIPHTTADVTAIQSNGNAIQSDVPPIPSDLAAIDGVSATSHQVLDPLSSSSQPVSGTSSPTIRGGVAMKKKKKKKIPGTRTNEFRKDRKMSQLVQKWAEVKETVKDEDDPEVIEAEREAIKQRDIDEWKNVQLHSQGATNNVNFMAIGDWKTRREQLLKKRNETS